MKKIQGTNDFVIRFANVNGSGSASANNLFAKAVFRMRIPVSPKNIFPSNIQGLPTWYEVRINDQGYLGRRGGYDFIVAVNGKTLRRDYDGLAPGGYFLYDATRTLGEEYDRQDIIPIAIPLTELCNREVTNPRLRQLLKNIVYIGALAFLLDMDLKVFTDSITQQFSKKPKLAAPNIRALELGYGYASRHFHGVCGLAVTPKPVLSDHIMMDGNSAVALGAVYSGATVAGWYPITPSTSVVDAFDRFTRRLRKDEQGRRNAAIIQAEDELAALGIAMGAAWNGARAFTATSGPGISLMNELLGLAYFAEIPVVLVNVQRTGPSTGMPTRTQQADIGICAHASHGDTRHVMLFPCDPKECFEMAADAFDLADRLQTPVMLMSDLDLGMNDHVSRPMTWDDGRRFDRGKVLTAEQLEQLDTRFGRYLDVDGDGICYRTYPGTHPEQGAYFTRGSSHDEYAGYTEDEAAYARSMERLNRKWETAKTLVPEPHIKIRDLKSTDGVLFFGTSTHAVYEALNHLEENGKTCNTLRIRSFPFPPSVAEFIHRHDRIFVVEQNRDGQMRDLLITALETAPEKLISITSCDGLPVSATHILTRMTALETAAGDSHPQGGTI